MLGSIQIAQGSKIGGTIVIEVRGSERREICLCQVELGFCRGKLCFVVVAKCVELCLLTSRCIFNGWLKTRDETPQFDVSIDTYIAVKAPVARCQHTRKKPKRE